MDRRPDRRRLAPARVPVDQGVRSAVQRALQGRQVVSVPRDHPRARGPAGHRHAQQADQGGEVLRAVPEGVGSARHDRPDDQGVPDPHLQRLLLRARHAHRPAVLPRPDRQVRWALLPPGHARGAPCDGGRLHRVHAGRRRALHTGSHAPDEGGGGRDGLRGGRGAPRQARLAGRGAQQERARAPRPRGRRRVRHRRGRALRGRAPLRHPRRPGPRRSLDDDRQGARHPRRRARRAGPSAFLRRRCGGRRAAARHRPLPSRGRRRAESLARGAARQAGRARCRAPRAARRS